jgi:hypothetical protein
MKKGMKRIPKTLHVSDISWTMECHYNSLKECFTSLCNLQYAWMFQGILWKEWVPSNTKLGRTETVPWAVDSRWKAALMKVLWHSQYLWTQHYTASTIILFTYYSLVTTQKWYNILDVWLFYRLSEWEMNATGGGYCIFWTNYTRHILE